MTSQEIRSVVIEQLCQAVEELNPESIDTSVSMKTLGANSLDIVEVVSNSMRKLKLKVARSELAKLENVDGLIELCERAAAAQAAAEAQA